jgi:4-amino-4-deoxy-L-arabinose transferase-like glycosyltransferase
MKQPQAKRPIPPGIGWIALAAMILRGALLAGLDLYADEAYYWTWSLRPAFGYFDHPPMVAWLIGAFSHAVPGEFGVRLAFILCGGANVLLAGLIARELSDATRAPAYAALLAATSPMLTLTGAVALPDGPQALFFTTAIWFLVRRDGPRWIAAGVALGLAMLSKYTAVLLAPAALTAALVTPPLRADLRTWKPWAGGLLAALLFVPCLIWNAQHDFVSFRFQLSHGLSHGGSAHPLLELLGSLIGGSGLVVIPGAIVFFWRDRSTEARILGLAVLAPLVALAGIAMHSRVEANWPALIYPALSAAAGAGLAEVRRMAGNLAVGVSAATGVAAMLFLGIEVRRPHFVAPSSALVERLHGWRTIIPQVVSASGGATFVIPSSYQYAAELAYYAGWRRFGATFGRPSQFDVWDDKPGPGDKVVVVSGWPLTDEEKSRFNVDRAGPVATASAYFAGALIRRLWISPVRSATDSGSSASR